MKLKLKVMYMFTGGFYTYSIFALIFWETRRSDFSVSMGHHIASVMLITMSYICRFACAGSVTLALHDGSDVFLEVGKMSKYGGAEGLASLSFNLVILSWVVLRLIYFLFWIIWSTTYEVPNSRRREGKSKWTNLLLSKIEENLVRMFVLTLLSDCLLKKQSQWLVGKVLKIKLHFPILKPPGASFYPLNMDKMGLPDMGGNAPAGAGGNMDLLR